MLLGIDRDHFVVSFQATGIVGVYPLAYVVGGADAVARSSGYGVLADT